MKKGTIVYALLVLGIGDDENAWELAGVFSTEKKAETYLSDNFEDGSGSTLDYRIEPRHIDCPEQDFEDSSEEE